jgi:hypothetical protein
MNYWMSGQPPSSSRVGRPASRVQPAPHAVKIGWRRQLASDPNDRRADIGGTNTQLAASHQAGDHCRYLIVGQPTPQQRQQRDVIGLGDPLRVAGPHKRHKLGHQIAQNHATPRKTD